MVLAKQVDTLENVSEDLKGLYVEKDGRFNLNYELIEGVKPLDEFDTVYNALKKERELHKQTNSKLREYGEHTPESIRELNSRLAELELNGGNNEDIESRLEKALKIKTAPFIQERDKAISDFNDLNTKVQGWEKERKDNMLKDAIVKIVNDPNSPFKPASVTDMYNRAIIQKLEYNEEAKVFVAPDGRVITTWAFDEGKTATWLNDSVGGGAIGGKNVGSRSQNPFETGNLTEQTRLYRENPAEYERLKKISKK